MDRCEIEVHYTYVLFHTYRKKTEDFRRSFFPFFPSHFYRWYRPKGGSLGDEPRRPRGAGCCPGGAPSDWENRRERSPKARTPRFKICRLRASHAMDRRLTKLGNNRGQLPVNICGRSDLGRKRGKWTCHLSASSPTRFKLKRQTP